MFSYTVTSCDIAFFLNCHSIIFVPIFSPLPISAHPIPHSHSQFPPCCPCPWVIHTYSLTSPFPFFPPLRPFPHLWLLSVCSVFPCLWFYFKSKTEGFTIILDPIIYHISVSPGLISSSNWIGMIPHHEALTEGLNGTQPSVDP